MAVVAHLESGVYAADVHLTVCRAVSCDGGFVHWHRLWRGQVSGLWQLQPGSSSLLLQLFFMTLALCPL